MYIISGILIENVVSPGSVSENSENPSPLSMKILYDETEPFHSLYRFQASNISLPSGLLSRIMHDATFEYTAEVLHELIAASL